MRNNAFFQEMKRVGYAYEDAKAVRREIKKKITDAPEWDDEAYAAWKAEEEKHPFPFTRGEMDAYHAWDNTVDRGQDWFEANDNPFESDMEDFVGTLRKAEIKHITLTSQSTNLMMVMHKMQELGCTMTGLETHERVENRWGKDETYLIQGVGFDL